MHSAITAFADSAALKIVEVAEQHDCDLIFMGSHGRSGLGQLLLGSVTNKVLSHTLKPVLVHRLIKEPAHLVQPIGFVNLLVSCIAPTRKLDVRSCLYARPGCSGFSIFPTWRPYDSHCHCRRPHDHA